MLRPFIIPFLISCWVLALPGFLYAQDCDCEGSGACPATIPTNSMGSVCFDLTDALNNDLANPDQGVCGVEVTFTHQHIWDLELWLVSPGGDTVQLTGPNINTFGTTNSVLWNLTFVPCAVPPVPDTINSNPLEEVWTNDQNWPFAGVVTGSYHPFAGCLEDFDSGPANGSWCLLYENDPSTYSGNILNFEVILCDQSGFFCCDADAGSLNAYPDVLLCENHPDLLLDIPPNYLLEEPDSLEYGYTYLVADANGLLLEYDTLPDLSDEMPGTYTVCGFSYRLADSLNIPPPDGTFTLDDLELYLQNDANMLCGDITTSCVEVTIVAPPAPTMLADTICEGDTYTINGTDFTDPGAYEVIFQTAAQCDSIVNLELTVLPLDTTYLTETVCVGESFTVGTVTYDSTGLYETPLAGMFGCDSLVILDLTVLDSIRTDLTDTICFGETYTVGNQDFTDSGIFEVTLSGTQGCDSLVVLDLTVLDLTATIAPPDTITCLVSEVILDGTGTSVGTLEWSSPDGTIIGATDQLTAVAGAGGTYILTVSQAGCLATDTVMVVADTLSPVAEAGPPDSLTCIETSLLLDGSGSDAGPGFSLLWTTNDGNIVDGEDGPNPLIDQAGTYVLTVTNTASGCTAIDSTAIFNNQIAPLAEAGPDGLLTCVDTVYTLDGSASFDPDLIFNWEDAAGMDLFWFGDLQAEVNTPGWYYLIAEDPANGCVSIDSAQVTIDQSIPDVQIALPDTLTCAQTEIILDASASDTNPDYQPVWSTQTGNIIGSPDTFQATVDGAGTYTLQITDSENGCVGLDSVAVLIDTLPPLADAGVPSVELECGFTEFVAGEPANTSQGPGIFYEWEDENGGTVASTLQYTVSTEGVFFLTVLDIANGCTATDSIVVIVDQEIPVADIGAAGVLTCDMPTDSLGGPGTTTDPTGVELSYAWYLDGVLLPFNDLMIEVSTPGEYCFVVTNNDNFCADTACTVVLADATLPIADAGPDVAIDCIDATATMDGSNSTIDTDVVYAWTHNGGNILSDPSQSMILVEGPGVFILQVTDTLNDCFTVDSAFAFIDTTACLPFAAAGSPGVINCYNFPADTLDASASSAGPHINYQWTALTGTILDDDDTVNPVVTAGTYALAVTNTVLQLTAYDTVQVVEDLDTPLAEAGATVFYDCGNLGDTLLLDGTGSSTGPQFQYLWSAIDGNIVSGADSLLPAIDLPGIYSIEVLNLTNGCSASDAVLVDLDGAFPASCLPPTLSQACGEAFVTVADTCAAQQPNYVYAWTVSNGTLLSNPTLPQIDLEPAAPFTMAYLQITDTTNSCVTIDSVQVLPAVACFPECEIAMPSVLTCTDTTLFLNATGSSTGVEFVYSWSTTDGNFCGGEDSLMPCVNAPGTYELLITDTLTQFTCSADVTVTADVTPPLVEAGTAANLNCTVATVQLDGSATPVQPGDSLLWTGPDVACFTGPINELETGASCPGWYYLTVISAGNGCSATDSVLLALDTLAPAAILAAPDTLSCTNAEVLLDGTASAAGANIAYEWLLNGVSVASGADLNTYPAGEAGTWCLTVTNLENGCTDTVCTNVPVDAGLPVSDAGPDQILTCQDTLLTITGSGMGSGLLSFAWEATNGGCITGPADQASIEVACTGTYTLTVTDSQNGCSATSSMVVTENTDLPAVDAGPDQQLTCIVTSVSLDGSASAQGATISYNWTTPNGNVTGPTNMAVTSADTAGLYILTVLNTDNGCSSVDTTMVSEQFDLPTVDAGPDQVLTCAVNEVNLDGSNSAQGPNITYAWMPLSGGNIISGADAADPLVDATGLYQLLVTNMQNGCSDLDTVAVLSDLEAPLAQIDSTGLLRLDCNNTSLTLLGNASSPMDSIDFQWSTGNGNIIGNTTAAQITVDSAGLYQLVVEMQRNGCRDTTTVEVWSDFSEPLVSIANPATLTCTDTAVVLDGTGSDTGPVFSYQWTPQAGSSAIILDPTTLTPTVFAAEIFTLTITNTDNGCTATAVVEVPEDREPPLAVATTFGSLDCDSLNIPLLGEGSSTGPAVTYFWEGPGDIPDPDQQNINGTLPGWYQLTVTDTENGCSASDSVQLTAFALPIYGLAMTVDSVSCLGQVDGGIVIDSVIGGTPPFLYSLNGEPFATYTQYLYLPPGEYELAVLDVNGCEGTFSATIGAGNDPQLELGPDLELLQGETGTISAQLSISPGQIDTLWWEPLPDPNCPDCLQQIVMPQENTTYSLTVVDVNGCKVQDNILVRIDAELRIFMPNVFRPDGDGINDLFYPQSGREDLIIRSLRIFDRWGNLVYHATDFPPNNPAYGWDGTHRGQPMNPAVFGFWMEVETGNGTRKLVKGDVLLVR